MFLTKLTEFLKKTAVIIVLPIFLVVLFLCADNSNKLSASLFFHKQKAFIEIDGINYGFIEDIAKIEQLAAEGKTTQLSDYRKITLNRSFVTEPSLYHWAKTSFEQRKERQNITIIVKTDNEYEIKRYTLNLCKPLSWALTKDPSSTNGFQETVKLAVQDISAYGTPQ